MSTSYVDVSVDKYVIMPNHIHLLITIAQAQLDTEDNHSRKISLHSIIRSFKTMVTKNIGYSVWQDSYYDHIIRDESDYRKVWEYIDCNPDKWQEDELFG